MVTPCHNRTYRLHCHTHNRRDRGMVHRYSQVMRHMAAAAMPIPTLTSGSVAMIFLIFSPSFMSKPILRYCLRRG